MVKKTLHIVPLNTQNTMESGASWPRYWPQVFPFTHSTLCSVRWHYCFL